MRSPRTLRRRGSSRGRLVVVVAALLVLAVFFLLRSLAEVWTDYLWFDSVGMSEVWRTTLFTKVQLGAIFTGVFFVALYVNLLVVDRLAPRFAVAAADDEVVQRYHELVGRRAGSLRFTVAAVFALLTGAGVSAQWQEWLQFLNGGSFGIDDPNFGVDVGFYVFRLPFLVGLTGWVFASLVIILLITAVAYYLSGGIRFQTQGERVAPQVKAHLSVLLALLALVKAADYWLQRYMLSFSERSGVVSGVTATAENAELPALYLLLFIALGATVLFLINSRRKGWVLPVVAMGIWGLVQLVVGEAYPAVYERFIVVPEQSTQEQVPIEHNIAATRQGFGLDDVETTEFPYSTDSAAAAQAVTDNPEVVRNVQLLDPQLVGETFQRKQSTVEPYRFAGVETDRYPMTLPDGQTAMTQVVLANREIDPDKIPVDTWEATRLTYTHGYGFALSAVSAVTTSGTPEFSVYDIPLQERNIDLPVTRPQIYFGERMPTYSIVGTSAPEFGGVGGGPAEPYSGSGGVALDSLARQMAFAVRFNDWNIVISNFITNDSRILYKRDIRERARTLAPFLAYDSAPYPVVSGDRIVYVLDAYTTSSFYPNSQPYSGTNLPAGDLRDDNFNYVRNSVKVVIDTYDGTMSFYVLDEDDPVIAAYRSAFPALFKSSQQAPEDLRRHWRYPVDLFRVQTDQWGRYHITDPKDFYKRQGAWEPPPAPPVEPPTDQTVLLNQQLAQQSRAERMAPYYVFNRFPGDVEPNFQLLRPFQPFSEGDTKNKLTAFMVAKSDADGPYGKLQTYTVPADAIDGPAIVTSTVLADQDVSQKISLLGKTGSKVRFGDLVLVPIDRSVMWVWTMYVVAEGQTQVPVVSNVIVTYGNRVVMETTLERALRRLFPTSRPVTFEGGVDLENPDATRPGTDTGNPEDATTTTTTPTPPGTGVEPGADVSALVARANQLLQEAQTALDAQDLGTYQQKVAEASEVLRQAAELAPSDAGTTTSTTTAPESTSTTEPVATEGPVLPGDETATSSTSATSTAGP